MDGDNRSLAQTFNAHPSFSGATALLGAAIDAQAAYTVQRSQVKIALLALMLTARRPLGGVASGATVSGVVRDAQGVAQMGALVQVLASDSSMVGDGVYRSARTLSDRQSCSRKI